MAAWQQFVNGIVPLAHGNGTKVILMLGGEDANDGGQLIILYAPHSSVSSLSFMVFDISDTLLQVLQTI
jgi:hypothetical protein